MKFQILKVIVWAKKRNVPSPYRVVDFHPGKVNVITGSSRTGKTALAPIIDYCLGSSSYEVPIQEIRDNVDWYGVVVLCEDQKILLARKAAENSSGLPDYYFERFDPDAEVNLPERPERNTGLSEVKERLNEIAGITYTDDPVYGEVKGNHVGFRDAVHIVFQEDETIGSKHGIFKELNSFAKKRLVEWFGYLVGAENKEMINKRILLDSLKKDYKTKELNFKRASAVYQKWSNDLLFALQRAAAYGFADGENIPKDESERIALGREIIEKWHRGEILSSESTVDTLGHVSERQVQLEREDDKEAEKLRVLSIQLTDLNRFIKRMESMNRVVDERLDRLQIGQWIEAYRRDAGASAPCPLCGSTEHPATTHEINKVSEAVEEYARAANSLNRKKFTESYKRNKDEIEKKIAASSQRRQMIKAELESLMRERDDANSKFQTSQDVFMLLGQLKATVELSDDLIKSEISQEALDALRDRIDVLQEEVAAINVRARLGAAIEKIGRLSQVRLQGLDVAEVFKKEVPRLSVSDLNLKVTTEDGRSHLMTAVGSTSNIVALHIAYACALQEFFTAMPNGESCVPSFTMFDQPSRAYFPTKEEEKKKVSDTDIDHVRSIFKTLADSVRNTNGSWQAIVVDHADGGVYGGVDDEMIVEVANWRDGDALIRREWLDASDD